MIPLITIPGSQDPGSPPLHISTSCGAAALCVYQHAVGTAYAYAVLHVPCTGVTPDPMPHTFGPRCRSLGSLVWGNPRIHDPGIYPRYHRIALVWGLRPLGLLLRPNLWPSGPTVSSPRALTVLWASVLVAILPESRDHELLGSSRPLALGSGSLDLGPWISGSEDI